MNIYEFRTEYHNLTVKRRKAFLYNLVDHMVDGEEEDDVGMSDLLELFLNDAEAVEQDDGFGTEGFKG